MIALRRAALGLTSAALLLGSMSASSVALAETENFAANGKIYTNANGTVNPTYPR